MSDGDSETTVVFDPDVADSGKLFDSDTLASVLAPTAVEEIAVSDDRAEDSK